MGYVKKFKKGLLENSLSIENSLNIDNAIIHSEKYASDNLSKYNSVFQN